MPTIAVYIPERVYETWREWLKAWRGNLGDKDATAGEVLTGIVNDRKFWPPKKGAA